MEVKKGVKEKRREQVEEKHDEEKITKRSVGLVRVMVWKKEQFMD